jgi:5,10-methylenetetrahydromethanopterin reductase
MVEFWKNGFPVSHARELGAEQAEADGWDGQLAMDSQNLCADPYVVLGTLAQTTSRIGLGTGVTNPLTRHPAATAAAIASVQVASNGRAVLGIGRGDSALAYIGRAPAALGAFERSLHQLQAYLGGSAVDMDELGREELDRLGLREQPHVSQLRWLPPQLPKVPIDVAASGPKVLELAAPLVERVSVTVGADRERVQWAVDTARNARERAGLQADELSIGAWVCCAVHPEREVARSLAVDSVATVARFSAMHGTPVGPVRADDDQVLRAIARGYDMTRHSSTAKVPSGTLTTDFIDRFAIVGPVEHCVERFVELVLAGVRRFVVIGPWLAGDRPDARLARTLMSTDVIPAVRAACQSA